jgi:hypothetical protein
MTDEPHFNIRCRERGIVDTDPGWLWNRITESIREGDGFVELVKTSSDNRYWRFFVEDGRFYAVTKVDSPKPVTIYTHEMFRRAARFSKLYRKGKPRHKMVMKAGKKGLRHQ